MTLSLRRTRRDRPKSGIQVFQRMAASSHKAVFQHCDAIVVCGEFTNRTNCERCGICCLPHPTELRKLRPAITPQMDLLAKGKVDPQFKSP